MTAFFSDTAVISSVTQVCGLLNSGGTLKIYTGSQPADANQTITGTLLVTCTFSSTAFGTPTASGSAGSRVVTATANPITSGTAGNTGTAGYFVLEESGGAVVAMGACGTSGSDLNLNTLSIINGASVAVTSFTVTQVE
jgi:hypothetical protein